MKCPFCSAPVKPNWPSYRPGPQDGISWFMCGTLIRSANLNRGDQTRVCVEKEVARLKARIARLEEAGDSLKEEARPTMFDCNETRKRRMDAIDAWDAAREVQP